MKIERHSGSAYNTLRENGKVFEHFASAVIHIYSMCLILNPNIAKNTSL